MTLTPAVPPKVLVFDSGAGGLSIAKNILEKAPGVHLICAADNAFFPYGNKADQALLTHIINQVGFWYRKHSPDMVVIACNTASTLALDSLRKKFPCPFVGVVPAIKPAAKLSKSGVIGVLATPATVSRQYTQLLINKFACSEQVLLHGSDALVQAAETKITTGKIDVALLKKELEGLFSHAHGSDIDTIVLACTHFPLLKPELKNLYHNKSIEWVDSGEAVANRVASLLRTQAKEQHSSPKVEFEFASHNHSNEFVARRYHEFLYQPQGS